MTDVCSSVRDGTHDTPKYIQDGIPLITSKNLKTGVLDFSTAKLISPDDHRQISIRSGVEHGDILFAMIGTIGNPVIVHKSREFSIKNIGLFKRNSRFLKPEYLRFWLSSYSFERILEQQKLIKGTTQKFIPLGTLRNLPLPIPPLNEQRRIVTKIEELTAHSRRAREALDDVPTLINQFRQSVLAAAFRGDLTADWREKNPNVEPAEKLLERIRVERRQRWEEAELGKMKAKSKEPKNDKWKDRYKKPPDSTDPYLAWIPESWTSIALDELAKGTSNSLAIGPFGSNLKVIDYRDEGVPLVFVREIRAEIFGDLETKFVSPEKAAELKSHSVSSGDLLITKMGDPPGDTAVYPTDRPLAVITADCIKLSPDTSLSSSTFLKYWLRSRPIKDRILEETKGVAQQKLSLKRFRQITIPLPPAEEQKIILIRLRRYFRFIENVLKLANESDEEINLLGQSILAKAFRGELVPQAPNDEPASVLLERIRTEREKLATTKKKGRTSRKEPI